MGNEVVSRWVHEPSTLFVALLNEPGSVGVSDSCKLGRFLNGHPSHFIKASKMTKQELYESSLPLNAVMSSSIQYGLFGGSESLG